MGSAALGSLALALALAFALLPGLGASPLLAGETIRLQGWALVFERLEGLGSDLAVESLGPTEPAADEPRQGENGRADVWLLPRR